MVYKNIYLAVGGADYPMMVFEKGGATQGGRWSGGDLHTFFDTFLITF